LKYGAVKTALFVFAFSLKMTSKKTSKKIEYFLKKGVDKRKRPWYYYQALTRERKTKRKAPCKLNNTKEKGTLRFFRV